MNGERTRPRWFPGLPILVLANYFLRHTLEHANNYLYAFIPYFYPAAERVVFSPAKFPVWKLLLPIKDISGTWTTTGLIFTHVVELWLGAPSTWVLFNMLLVVASFATAFAVFRSNVIAYTFAICMGFGTQLYHTYAVSGTVAMCLVFIYAEVVLLAAWRVIEGREPKAAWRATFFAALVIFVLSYEAWLDLLVFGWMAGAILAYLIRRHGKTEWRDGLRLVMVSSSLAAVLYVGVKTTMGYAQQAGSESDLVLNYHAIAPIVEDTYSTVLSNFYIAATNFLPPSLVSSNSFFTLGGDRLVALQSGYHDSHSYLVVMNHLFLWRYAAGALFVAFVYLVVRALLRLRDRWSADDIALALAAVMTLTGGPMHALVKVRPMHAMPLLGYHVYVGILGISVLIAYATMLAAARLGAAKGRVVVASVWAIVFWSALSRPALLAHEAAQVGFAERIYPDPKATLLSYAGITPSAPAGLDEYRLTRYSSTGVGSAGPVGPPGFERPMPPLPGELPPFNQWLRFPKVTVTPLDPASRGFRVEGYTAAGGGGYELQSPPIAVVPHQRMLFRFNATMEQGRACVGILNEKQTGWMLAPDGAEQEYGIDTGENRRIWIVLADCSGQKNPVAPKFTITRTMTVAVLQAPDPTGANAR